ncbi:cohesin domain-containing protein [Roseateles asaccharophilus]|uniref:General secretion pathway protein D n=1 Tax=Roseateles asaccharophilus TaxID=582607 RepID=A0ABU2ADX3_9BURK|nr:cohesin domain-containing protein [Roseateles asaccharophilus]MDR7335402.1 general secretion pathway protein D [Roseateles asaccharophilus]
MNRQARQQMADGRYEEALQTLTQGVKQHPDNLELRGAWLRAKNEALTKLITEAGAARAQGQAEAAEQLLVRASQLDPDNARVRDLATALATERRQDAVLAEADQKLAKGQGHAAARLVTEALKSDPRHAGLVAWQRKYELGQRTAQLEAARGSLAEVRPISLDFRDTPLRTVLDAVTRHSGLNFVFDKDIRADLRVTLFLNNVRVEDALDLIVSTHQMGKKVLDSRTVLIYPNTPDKQREYQELVVRTFYLANADVRQASAFMKSMLKVREPFVDERSNMLALREAPETIQLAERLLASFDAAEPEVTLELEVLEVSSTRLTELGIKFPDTLALTPLSAAGASGLTVSSLESLNRDRIGVSVSGLLLNLRRQVGDFETLASPRVRIKNREKAKVLVGNKLPVVTTTAAATGFVSENVSYLDVGLKLDLEPIINVEDEVTIKVGLEVSSLQQQIKTSSGTLAYQLGTRNASTVLRLRDGETQVLAGLISREETSNASRVPGLGDLPVVGRLFSSQLNNGTRTELVLGITPRIVRNVRRPDISESEMWVGTETYGRLRAVGGRAISVAESDAEKPKGSPTPEARADAAPADAPAVPGRLAAVTGGELSLGWRNPPRVKVGDVFEVDLVGQFPNPVRGLNMSMRFDPKQVELIDIQQGGFWAQAGGEVSFSRAVDAANNQLQFGIIRKQAQGVEGEGEVVRLRLKALREGKIDWPIVQVAPLAAGPKVPQVKQGPALKLEVLK